MIGKRVRLQSFVSPDGKSVLIPVDQAVTVGPAEGLENARRAIARIAQGRPDAIIAHRGLHQQGLLAEYRIPVLLHISAGTRLSGAGHAKTRVAHVEDAVRLGAAGISMHVTFGVPEEREMLSDLGAVASGCLAWGLPLLVMIYVHDRPGDAEALAHAARVAAELGADLVKLPFGGPPDELASILEGCFVPVLMAGGQVEEDGDSFYHSLAKAMELGASGACVGRNAFSAVDPARAIARMREIVHGVGHLSPSEPVAVG